MKNLVNYCPIDFYEKELKTRKLGDLLKEIGLDGIEQFVYQQDVDIPLYKDLTVGVHLKYWPYWLDFYLDKKSYYNDFSLNPKLFEFYWQSRKPEEWVLKIQDYFRTVEKYESEYLVWHVAQADDSEIFTYNFKYRNKEVLDYTIEIINEVSKVLPKNRLLLFENLWWPGLTLLEPNLVEYFFSRINHTNVGIMLDTGHLMNTNPHITSEEQGIDYMLSVVDKLGYLSKLIKGLHLNCSLSGEYVLNFPRQVPDELDTTKIWRHVTSIDQHKNFTSPKIQALISKLNPEYVTHEFNYDSLSHMVNLVRSQMNCLKK